MNTIEQHNVGRSSGRSYWLGFCLLAAIAVFFLWEEHKAHILGVLTWSLLLACPLIHLFMHRGHGHSSIHGQGPESGERSDHRHTQGGPS